MKRERPPMNYKSLFKMRLTIYVSLIIAICTGLTASVARGQALDSVDIERRGNATEINVRFITYVQYLRHAPPDFGKSLRIYVQLTGGGVQPSDLIPLTKRFSRTGETPQITVSFPESDNSLLITFDQPTKYAVRPGSDGRSIIVLLPAAAEK